MTNRVLALMPGNISLWENEPEIVEVMEAVQALMTSITVKGSVESGLSGKGYTSAKDITLDNLVTKTCKLSKKISGYAKKRKQLEISQ
jgi:hypothetical protein